MNTPRVIAFYLPQYHPFKENDEWWGKGFTEWTNVAKAKPLFRGHYQPKIPADMGFYDLRLPEVREEQARLAREAGIEGFCYYHYWFGDGFQLMERPFNEVVKSGEPNFPFCLCWANESWGNKMWNKDGSVKSVKILAEQKYLGEEDNEKHFYSLLNAFKDTRYIKNDGRLLFMIYRPLKFHGIEQFMKQWNDLAIKNGLPKFFFIGQCVMEDDIDKCMSLGLDAINYCKLYPGNPSLINKIYRRLFSVPRIFNYSSLISFFNSDRYKEETVYPTLIPNWDHSPRSGNRSMVFHGSTPELFNLHIKNIFETIKGKKDKIVFLKSWNEWGEGNYVEPDLLFGCGYLNALRKNIVNNK